MPTAVVTGASRGIGSEFVVRLLESGWKVYAGYRSDKHRLELIDNENLLTIKISEKFVGERGRINCSLRDPSGFWRWLGLQYVISDK